MTLIGTTMKIFLGLLFFVAAIFAQNPPSGRPAPPVDPGAIDYSNNLGVPSESQPSPPTRKLRPGVLKKRTRPGMTTPTSSDDSQMTTESNGEPDSTTDSPTESEYTKLTKNLKFDCSEQAPGFYANVDTGCRIWHYCFGAIRYDQICPSLTLFDQELVTCVYASDTDCSKAPTFYDKNKLLYITTPRPLKNPNAKQQGVRRRIRPRPTAPKPMDYSDFDSSQIPVANQ